MTKQEQVNQYIKKLVDLGYSSFPITIPFHHVTYEGYEWEGEQLVLNMDGTLSWEYVSGNSCESPEGEPIGEVTRKQLPLDINEQDQFVFLRICDVLVEEIKQYEYQLKRNQEETAAAKKEYSELVSKISTLNKEVTDKQRKEFFKIDDVTYAFSGFDDVKPVLQSEYDEALDRLEYLSDRFNLPRYETEKHERD